MIPAVVIIQAGLANRSDFSMPCKHLQLIKIGQVIAQIKRMHAYRRVDAVKPLGNRGNPRRLVQVDADTQHTADACLPGRSNGGLKAAVVGAQVEAIQVTMGVDQHDKFTWQ